MCVFFFQAEDGIRDAQESRGLGDVYKRQAVYLGNRVIVLSGAPAKVARDIVIDLPRERDQIATKLMPRYAQLRAEVFELIQEAKRPRTQAIGAVRA